MNTVRRLKPVSKPQPPVGGLMDPRFVYVPARETDIRKTFERVRAEASFLTTPKKAKQ